MAVMLNLTFSSPSARADDIVWLLPSDGAFNDAANWSGGIVPGSGDTVTFSLNASEFSQTPYRLTVTSDIATRQLQTVFYQRIK